MPPSGFTTADAPADREHHHPDPLRWDYLPPELQVAPREFDAWSQSQLLKEQDASTPTAPLYHYTGEEALKGILSRERLWCFAHQHQKDRQEFEYSVEIARRVIKQVGDTGDSVIRHFCACLIDLLDHNSIASTFEFYLFSLSRHEDDPQQWREYAHDGSGFAIGFAPVLFAPNEMRLKEQANENLHVGRVVYGDAATEARHRLVIETAAAITSRVAWSNRALLTDMKPITYLRAMALEVIASQLIWNCLTAKRDTNANEREVRYIIMNITPKFDAHRKEYNGRNYIEASLPLKSPCSIMKILVGPNAQRNAEHIVSDFLKAHGYPDGIPVQRSSASFECLPAIADQSP
jgi:hypothetical protein